MIERSNYATYRTKRSVSELLQYLCDLLVNVCNLWSVNMSRSVELVSVVLLLSYHCQYNQSLSFGRAP